LTILDKATTWSGNIFQQTPSERVQHPRAAELSCNKFSLYSGFETYRWPLAWESCFCEL